MIRHIPYHIRYSRITRKKENKSLFIAVLSYKENYFLPTCLNL